MRTARVSLLILMGIALLPLRAMAGDPGGHGGLPAPLRGVEIKGGYLPSSFREAGTIEALRGRAVILHRGTNEAFFAKVGDPVHENDAVYTLSDSRCRIRFLTRDVASLARGSEFSVDAFLDQRQEGKKTAIFTMLAGKIKFYALRLLLYRESRVTVKTPTAIIGVRGTHFGVHVYWDRGETRAGCQGTEPGVLVAEAGGPFHRYLAGSGDHKGRSYTDAHCTDGEIEVNGKPVPAGYMYQDKTGEIGPTDPRYLKAFDAETDVDDPGKGNGAEAPSASSPLTPLGQDPSGHADQIERLLEPRAPEPGLEGPREPPVGAGDRAGPMDQGSLDQAPPPPQQTPQPGLDTPAGARP